MSSAALVLYLQWGTVVGFCAVAMRLFGTGLHRRYRALFAFCFFRGICLALSATSSFNSNFYFYLFLVVEPIAWIFYIWLVLELYRLILERHRGFYTVGRWAMSAGLAVAVTLSVLALLPRLTPEMPQTSRALAFYFAAERGIDCALAIFLVFLLAFLNFYTVRLSRNLLMHSAIYTVFFLSSTLEGILRMVFGRKYSIQVNMVLMAISSVSVLAWFFLLSRKGEEAHVKQPWFGLEQEERILHHLDSLNATLMRAAGNK